jgi:hypothetical protein
MGLEKNLSGWRPASSTTGVSKMPTLSSIINNWLGSYDNYGLAGYNPAYVGSILATNGNFHTGGTGMPDSIYQQNTNNIYPFIWYAGQGVDHVTTALGGSKYLLYSEYAPNETGCACHGKTGFSWDTLDADEDGFYEFVTSGTLDVLYLGYTPVDDDAPSPLEDTLTTFDTDSPLLVVSNFSCLINYVAEEVFGVEDGNAAIDVDDLVDGNGDSILANPQYYESATLNSTIIYGLAFDNTATPAFEYVLDQYLLGISGGTVGIGSNLDVIKAALASFESCVVIDYYSAAGNYAANAVVTEALAQSKLCECDDCCDFCDCCVM